MDREPLAGCSQGQCYLNVKTIVALEGGDLLTGWALRIWKGCLVEAEQHAVWRQPNGIIVDVTPHLFDRRTAFSIDPMASFACNGLAQLPNRYVNIADGSRRALVGEFIDVVTKKMEYELQHKDVREGKLFSSADPAVVDGYLTRMRELYARLPKKSSF